MSERYAREDAFFFDCEGAPLLGITHVPPRPSTLGVVIMVGGPQYRVGSHRQFVLLSRALASSGFATLRFDYRGMGDSGGEYRGFDHAASDLRAAIDAFYRRLPGLQGVVLWGLCDAASAAACYCAEDSRVRALVLANPWVRSEAGQARALLNHYYRRRFFDPQFWRKLASGRGKIFASLRELAGNVLRARQATAPAPSGLPARMLRGLVRSGRPTLFILSGNDLVATEFRALASGSPHWRALFASPQVRLEIREDADHTFSCAAWRDEVAELTRAWMLDLARAIGH